MNLRNTILALAALAALAVALPAYAKITTLVRAVETSTKLLSVPTTASGRVLLRSCEECELHSPRLGPNTMYEVNEEALSFSEFRQAYYSMKGRDERYVLVSYDVESDIVTSVQVSTPRS